MSLKDFIQTDYAFSGETRYRTDGESLPKKDRGSVSYIWGLPRFPSQVSVAEGAAGVIEEGTYKFYCVGYSSTFGNRSLPVDADPVSVTITANKQIDVTSIPVFDDASVDRIEIYRTLRNTDSPFYRCETIDNGTTSKSTNKADVDLGTIAPVLEPTNYTFLPDSDLDFSGPFRYNPPPLKRFVETFDGRLWMAGERGYKKGLVSATDASEYITGDSSVNWNSRNAGRYLKIEGEDQVYQIDSVETGDRLKLTVPYERPAHKSSDPSGAKYCIIGEPSEIFFSEVDNPDYVPSTNSINAGLEEGGFITGLIAMQSGLYVFTEANIYIIYRTGDPSLPYGIRRTKSHVGTKSPRSIISFGGAIYFYSSGHFYIFDGDQSVVMSKDLAPLTPYPGTDVAVCAARENERIYWAFAHHSGDYLDSIYIYDTLYQFWEVPWRDLRFMAIEGIVHPDSSQYVYAVSKGGGGYHLTRFVSSLRTDLTAGVPYIGTVTSATGNTITDTSASFPVGLGLSGAIIRIDSGTGAYQSRRILSNTGDTVTVEDPWDVVPDTTSTYMIGGIEADVQSGRITLGQPHNEKSFFELEVLSGRRGD